MTDGRIIYRGGDNLTEGLSALPTAAQRCLLRAATGPVDQIEDALREWRTLVDLRGPIDGGSYRLIPAVFHRLSEHGLSDPDWGMLKGVYRLAMVGNTTVVHAITPALRALHEAGLLPGLTKGTALVAAGYYPTLACRPMADVDIVVDSADKSAAIGILRDLGYIPQLTDEEMIHLHGAAFVDASGHELDLHWHRLHHARSAEADELLNRASETHTLNGVPVQVPGPTGLLIETAVHGLIPNPEPPVRWLVDAAAILDHRGDDIVWDDVIEFADRFRLARRLELALDVLADTTGRTAPDRVREQLAAIPTSRIERLEKRLTTVPWNTVRSRVLVVIAGYSGADRDLKHVVTGFPRYLRGRWKVTNPAALPVAGARKVIRWLGPDRP